MAGADGRTDAVIEDGRFSPEVLRGAIITPIFNALKELADAAKGAGCGFRGQLLFAVDQRAAFETVTALFCTAGQAQFAEFRFLLADADALTLPSQPPGSRHVTARLSPGGMLALSARSGGGSAAGHADDLGPLLAEALGAESALGCANGRWGSPSSSWGGPRCRGSAARPPASSAGRMGARCRGWPTARQGTAAGETEGLDGADGDPAGAVEP